MKRRLLLFEDHAWGTLSPLSDVTAVPALAFGASSLGERWQRISGLPLFMALGRGGPIEPIHDRFKAESSGAMPVDPIVVINAAAIAGRWFESVLESDEPAMFSAGGRIAAARAPLSSFRNEFKDVELSLRSMKLPERQIDATWMTYPWDLVSSNTAAIESDLAGQPGAIRGAVHERACLLEPRRITIEAGAVVDPLAVLDARGGPIWIGAKVLIRAHTVVEGPCVVGAGTELLGGRIARSTIGPQCRIAGEVEECIWQGYANKRHHGFVGHSVIGPWVNLGALTTTSDLKNNYGAVRVWADGAERDSGSNKVGAFIGAHVKTGIGTLLPTGASVGTGANLFGGGRFAPKRVPAFGWWDGGELAEHEYEKFLATARLAMSRRGETLSETGAESLRRCFEASRAERSRR
ncbi:MAG: putative sugar nucleotidyl transferase [Candidatus Eiseniibacteriota bacterium]